MSSPSSVTFLFVHGAWHNSKCWSAPIALVRKAGYNTDAMDLPSVGFPDTQDIADFWGDVAVVRKHLAALIEAGRTVILVLHSYGGTVGTQAVEGFDVVPLDNDIGKGGVAQLIFLCAFVCPEGEGMHSLSETKPPWLTMYKPPTDTVRPAEEITPALDVLDPGPVFYHDVEPAVTAAAIAELRPHTASAQATVLTYAGWKTVPSTYIYCTGDRAIPIALQKHMAETVAAGYNMQKKTLEGSSHSPFYSRPEELAKVLLEVVEDK